MEGVWTVGAYGFDAESFFAALEEAEIDLFLDLRRRRGVRGAQYSFANAIRLKTALEDRGIPYRHLLELAPDEETRNLQRREDAEARIQKRSRAGLSEPFVAEYSRRALDPHPWNDLLSDLTPYRRPVLFCVERTPDACHRGLVAERLATHAGVPVTHLLSPDES